MELLQGEAQLSGVMDSDEPHRLPPRVLYGYVRVVRGDDERAAALTADLLTFCQTNGFMLGSTFTDWGVPDTELVRPGLSLLLNVCGLVGAYGVVVPAPAHLSTHTDTLATLTRQIQRNGVTLIAADDFESHLPGATAAAPRNTDTSAPDGGASC